MPSLLHAPAERRIITVPLTCELRDSGDGQSFTITGHAAVFDRPSEPLWTFSGQFTETIARGAFTDVLSQGPDVRLLFNHDDNYVLARTAAGTLNLTEDDQGLAVWARVAPTSYARDLRLLMDRGDVNQMSFMFIAAQDRWEENLDTGERARTILRVAELFDTSVVTFPAYPDTDVIMRELRAAARAGKIEWRGPIAFKETPKAPVDTAWDGPAEVARADVEDLRAMCAWYDEQNADSKDAYKLPHHRADASHPVVWRGVATAMTALLQPPDSPRRMNLPAADRRGVYEHLSRHYKQFDREAPEFRDLAAGEVLEGADPVTPADLAGGPADPVTPDDPAGGRSATPPAGGGQDRAARLQAIRHRVAIAQAELY